MVVIDQKNLSLVELLTPKLDSPLETIHRSILTMTNESVYDFDHRQPILHLPSDFLRTPSTPNRPAYHTFALPQCYVEWLKKKTHLKSVDGRSLLLAAFQALLYRYTQPDTILVELTLPVHYLGLEVYHQAEICTPIAGELTARDLIEQGLITLKNIQDQSIAVPDQSHSNNLKSRSPLPVAITFPEAFASPQDQEQWVSEFQEQLSKLVNHPDLHLVILQHGCIVSGLVQYNASLFRPDTIQRLSGHLHVLVEGMIQDLDCPIAQLPLLTQVESNQLLGNWNSGSVHYPQLPIHRYIETHAIQQPDAIALTFKNQYLTYAELNQRANQLAHFLNQAGVGANDRVAVCVEPSLEGVVSLLAIFKAGGVYVPLDPSHPSDRLATILADTQPQVLLTQSYLLAKLPAIAAHQFCLDQDWQTIQHVSTHNPANTLELDQTAYIVYTSGTTGKPKGVMASHHNLIHYILAAQVQYGFNCHDVMPAIARFTFSITFFELLSPLVAGGTLVLLERDHILDFKRLVQTLEQVSVIHTSASLMRKLLAYIQENGIDVGRFHKLRHVSSGGDLVPADLLETMKQVFPQAEIYVIYGCSEVSCMGCTYPVPRDVTLTKNRIGKAFKNVLVRLYDPQQNLVPIGVVGEIYIGGAGVNQGYLNRDDLTQEKFVTLDGQRFYRTGDLGRFDAEGNLEILGRADFQIQLRGIRMEPGEIEVTLRQIPGVRESVVAAPELRNGEKALVAYVVLDQAQKPTIAQMRGFLQAKLPDYMVPAIFLELDAMPLNLNQKIDRRALPTPDLSTASHRTHPVVPAQNELEHQLVSIWEAVLQVQPIGVHDNFFELGGHSLSAVQVLMQVEKLLGKTLPITTLLQFPTIAEITKLLGDAEPEAPVGDLVLLRPGGNQPPLFCLYGILLYRELAEHLNGDRPVYGVYLQEEVDLLKEGEVDMQNSIFASVPKIATRYLQSIRTLQPHGPYYLAGESFGGVVALEMAQQLNAVGEEVALVVLMDTYAPNVQRRLSFTQRWQLHWRSLLQQGLPYLGEKVQKNLNQVRQKLFSHFYKVYQQLSLGEEQELQSFAEAAHADIRAEVREQAIQSYVPQPYAGRVVLFRAQERDTFERELGPGLGWESLLENLQVFEVAGDHLGILKAPHVQAITAQLKRYL